MAKAGNMPMGSQKGMGELLARLRFLFLAIVVYRIGIHIPIPGINPERVAEFFNSNQGTILDVFNMFSGGALANMSILTLGVMPYISASIIMQLMGAVVPSLEQLKKEGDSGRRKLNQYTRYGTVLLALVQGSGIAVGLGSQGFAMDPGPVFYVGAVVSLVTGAVFMMWLGEQITERGVGNGISMLIFAGIVAGLPSAIGGSIEMARQGEIHGVALLFILILAIALIYFVVFMERGQRRITVNYAQRQQGRKAYNAQTSHLPLKVNMAGVIPAIFASSILLFPNTITTWFGEGSNAPEWVSQIGLLIGRGQPLYYLLFAGLIIFFCFFYTALMYNTKEMADNLKRGGAYLPGIRPGEQTSKYIDTVMTRLTVVGGIYMAGVCMLPEVLQVQFNVPFYLGGTSLLIAVVVTMDFMAQVQSHLMSSQYDSLMKKSNLKGKR
ncbi:preprotein translocase subunit SecY [bacterium SCSIO 12696]|nr:preprotein translocase subunit SecY [bacterium SCSIO 12696]